MESKEPSLTTEDIEKWDMELIEELSIEYIPHHIDEKYINYIQKLFNKFIVYENNKEIG